MFENYDKALELTEAAYDSTGSAMEKYNIYQESIAASQERITALFQKFVSNLDLSDVIKDVLEFAELLMKIVSSDALEWVLKLSPAILAVAYALRQVSKAASPLEDPD